MNEIPEGFEIVELGFTNQLRDGDILGALCIQFKPLEGKFIADAKTNELLTNHSTAFVCALAAANYRVLRKLPPPEPVVLTEIQGEA